MSVFDPDLLFMIQLTHLCLALTLANSLDPDQKSVYTVCIDTGPAEPRYGLFLQTV